MSHIGSGQAGVDQCIGQRTNQELIGNSTTSGSLGASIGRTISTLLNFLLTICLWSLNAVNELNE